MTDELVKKQDVIDAIHYYIESGYKCDIFQELKNLPSVEPEQKIGHWIDTDNYYQRWKCSECGYHTMDAEPNYCPSCGADMRMRGE